MKLEKDYLFLDLNRILPWLVLILFSGCLYLVFLVYRSYLISFFVAILFYIIFRTPHLMLLKRLGNHRALAATISTVVVIGVVFIPLIFVIISSVAASFSDLNSPVVFFAASTSRGKQ